ncbi:Spt20 family-domain-containing protein [Sparassis latifolia]
MVSYNITREVERLLETYKSSPPSFIVKLERQHWYVNENKFTYNHQLAPLLDDIRAQRIPVDFLELFDSVGLPFYDGCMIVELHDFRSPTRASDKDIKEPVKTRVVLSPNGETLWADICLLNQKTGNTWTGYDALEVEARLLLATSPPLCLDPDPHLARVANNILRTSIPTPPLSLKRKAGAAELEEDPSGKARREKLMQYMNPRTGNGVPK